MTTEALPCGEMIKRIHDIFETKANKDLQDRDITLSQMKMLIYLDQSADGSATLKELEKYIGSSQATVAGIAARLEKKDLIEGYIDADDRRIKHVRLSENGKELCWGAKASMEEGERWLLEILNSDEKRELQRLLQKIYHHIKL